LLALPLAAAVALTTWPHAELERLAPLAAMADIACIESNADGTMKQVTLLAWVAAPPSVMRDVIVRSEKYHEFIPNLSRSTNEPLGDGRWKSSWRMELPVSSFQGTNVYSLEKTADGGEAVLLKGDGDAMYRYEMLPVGEGTLLVQYGYTDVKHSNAFVRSFLKRQPMMEHGLALSAQMMFVTAMRAEAVRRAGAPRMAAPSTKSSSFAPLLARGQVAVMRADEVSVLGRVYASEGKVQAAIGKGADYEKFVPGVDKSYRREEGGGVYVEMSLPIVTWASTWMMRSEPHAVDAAAVEGDLRGARVRWDLSPTSAAETLVVYRARQRLEQSSMVLRKLFAFQPSLRLGINVALGLVWVQAVRGRAEGWR
jgi:ribosome-associated toxin RatA of RatAB toxin-antitoxin module